MLPPKTQMDLSRKYCKLFRSEEIN